MINVGFERVNQLLAISSSSSSTNLELNPKQPLEVAYVDYVKSQVHLNIADDLKAHPFRVYANALRYFKTGKVKYRSCALSTLRWFYSDMAGFLINNRYNLNLNCIVDFNLQLDEITISVSEVKQQLLQLIDNHSTQHIQQFQYAEILDFVKSSDDLREKIDNYALAAILLKYSEKEIIVRCIE